MRFGPTDGALVFRSMAARAGSASFGAQVAALPRRKIVMKAIIVTDQSAGTAGMTLVERPNRTASGVEASRAGLHGSGAAPAAREEREEADIEAASERCDRMGDMALRPERGSPADGSLGEGQV